jgi:hypothetical protein
LRKEELIMQNKGLIVTLFVLSLFIFMSGTAWPIQDSLWEKTAGGITVNMGVIPSNSPSIVCAKHHSEEEGVEDIRKETTHHLLFIFRDASTAKLVSPEKVHVKVYGPSGDMVASKSLDPEIYAGVVNFCNFFDLSKKGTYKVELSYMSNGNSYRVNFLM